MPLGKKTRPFAYSPILPGIAFVPIAAGYRWWKKQERNRNINLCIRTLLFEAAFCIAKYFEIKPPVAKLHDCTVPLHALEFRSGPNAPWVRPD
jgi:hypothetical protein